MEESEPTKEELLKRIAELEQQTQARKPVGLEFRVSEKGGGQRLRPGAVPGNALLRAVDEAAGPRRGTAGFYRRKQKQIENEAPRR